MAIDTTSLILLSLFPKLSPWERVDYAVFICIITIISTLSIKYDKCMPDFSQSGKLGEEPLNPNTALGGTEGHHPSKAAASRLGTGMVKGHSHPTSCLG